MRRQLSDLIDIIQQISQNAYKGMNPTDLLFGTVQSAAPLSVLIEGTMLPIPEVALVKTEAVSGRSVTCKTSDGATVTVPVSPGLAVGDRVVLMRCAAGQRFVILSKAY